MTIRWKKDAAKLGGELGIKSFALNSVTAYKKREDMTKSASFTQVVFDHKANALIVPILTDKAKMVYNYCPFHLRMIKNTSINAEKNITYLRINLHNP